jgi:hypothetical protein
VAQRACPTVETPPASSRESLSDRRKLPAGPFESAVIVAAVPMNNGEMAARLEPAGFRFVERVHGEVRRPVLPPGYSPASAGPEHGRFDSHPDEIADVDEPDMADKVNASWCRMALEYGLFSEEREFLLAVDFARPDALR